MAGGLRSTTPRSKALSQLRKILKEIRETQASFTAKIQHLINAFVSLYKELHFKGTPSIE
jgi:hypothetical protein